MLVGFSWGLPPPLRVQPFLTADFVDSPYIYIDVLQVSCVSMVSPALRSYLRCSAVLCPRLQTQAYGQAC